MEPSASRRLAGLRARYAPAYTECKGSDTAKAAGLAVAMIANNVIALGSTVVFARLLSDYGSLAALISYFLILSVVGQAMQVATAREGVLGHLGVGAGLVATLKRWTRTMAWFLVGITIVSVLLRDPIAQAVGVPTTSGPPRSGFPPESCGSSSRSSAARCRASATTRASGISLIGEQAGRLVVGAALAAAGLGVTGAYLGTPISFIAMGIYCAIELRRYAARAAVSVPSGTPVADAALELWTHIKQAWAPIGGLIVIAVLQNIDIIAAKHRFSGTKDLASSYAATAVAAKVLVWVAIGAGFYLVPEVSRRRAVGEDTRPVLAVALGIILVCAVPVLLIFGFAAEPLLRMAFGPKRLLAANSLFVLGVAFTVLAGTYLAIQYMLALKRTWFLVALGRSRSPSRCSCCRRRVSPQGFAAVVLGRPGGRSDPRVRARAPAGQRSTGHDARPAAHAAKTLQCPARNSASRPTAARSRRK